MAILVVWSSPNKDGLTAASAEQVVKGIQAAGKEAKVIHLNQKKVAVCNICGDGWGSCRTKGVCAVKDDFQEIYEQFQQAEGIVLVTPVYWSDLSENLKALLDRMRRCEPLHNRFLNGKRCLLVACAGGTGNGTIQCLEHMEVTLGHMGMKALDRIPVTRFSREYMMETLLRAGKMFALHYGDWQ